MSRPGPWILLLAIAAILLLFVSEARGYCGPNSSKPCPDEWFLLLDGTTYVDDTVPTTPAPEPPPNSGGGLPLTA